MLALVAKGSLHRVLPPLCIPTSEGPPPSSPPPSPPLRHAAKTTVYRLHVSADGSDTPLRLHMQGNDLLSGSHFDEYVVDYRQAALPVAWLPPALGVTVSKPTCVLWRCRCERRRDQVLVCGSAHPARAG